MINKEKVMNDTYEKIKKDNIGYESIIAKTVKKIRNSFFILSLGAGLMYGLGYYGIINIKKKTENLIKIEVQEYVNNSKIIKTIAKDEAIKRSQDVLSDEKIINIAKESIDSKVNENLRNEEIEQYTKQSIDKNIQELGEKWYNEEKTKKNPENNYNNNSNQNLLIDIPKKRHIEISNTLRYLNENIKYVIYVDKKNNKTKLIDAANSNVIFDFKSSDGVGGDGPKKKWGDEKTPEGIYHLSLRHFNPSFPDELHGSASLAINYPNSYDYNNGRSGSGISICGAKFNNRIRAIENGQDASNGSVILKNNDIIKIYNYVRNNINNTVAVIEDSSRGINLQNYKTEILDLK